MANVGSNNGVSLIRDTILVREKKEHYGKGDAW